MTYNSWPLGKIPRHMQRPELDQVKLIGYDWKDPRDVVKMFEEEVARFAGAKYAIAVDCATNGIFLAITCLQKATWYIEPGQRPVKSTTITIPSHTYISIPMQIRHAGCKVKFEDFAWSGIYQLKPYPIWDGAVRWTKGMYSGGLHVVSFQLKKRVPIGRGGMILTDDKDAYQWLKKASHDGRDLAKSYMNNDYDMLGWNAYMTPEDAARGLILMNLVPEINADSGNESTYSDLTQYKIFKSFPL